MLILLKNPLFSKSFRAVPILKLTLRQRQLFKLFVKCFAPGFAALLAALFCFFTPFSTAGALFPPASTHYAPAQPLTGESLAPISARRISQIIRRIHRLALHAAPMK